MLQFRNVLSYFLGECGTDACDTIWKGWEETHAGDDVDMESCIPSPPSPSSHSSSDSDGDSVKSHKAESKADEKQATSCPATVQSLHVLSVLCLARVLFIEAASDVAASGDPDAPQTSRTEEARPGRARGMASVASCRVRRYLIP